MVSPGASVVSAQAAGPVAATITQPAAKIRIKLFVIARIALFLSPSGLFTHDDRRASSYLHQKTRVAAAIFMPAATRIEPNVDQDLGSTIV
jgi:hypothetical protein